ncbi:MAG TPA: acyl carrier protein [Gemmatimonadales bacterium]
MDEPAILTRTRAYVLDTFLYMRPGVALGDGDRLLQKGVIDSMGVMELIGFLRSEFGVVVADEEITEQNLGTLADIARYVAGKLGNGGPAARD